jgi:hypothetical protein
MAAAEEYAMGNLNLCLRNYYTTIFNFWLGGGWMSIYWRPTGFSPLLLTQIVVITRFH